jgi:hypothetical protein
VFVANLGSETAISWEVFKHEFNWHFFPQVVHKFIRVVLEAQGWTEMVKNHRPAIAELVWEFYANIHQRVGDSFLTWVRGTKIHLTPNLINAITGASRVLNLEYP